MMRSLFSGVSGLKNHQTRMDVIGNNIANVNTVGYKTSRVVFQDIYSQTLRSAAGANAALGTGGINPMQIGLGMNIAAIDQLFNSSAASVTGQNLDVCISGDGFFIVGDGVSTMKYTRGGNFYVDNDLNLVTADGQYVYGVGADDGSGGYDNLDNGELLDVADSIINLTHANAATGSYYYGITINSMGEIMGIDSENDQKVVLGTMALATFKNQAGLEKVGGNCFIATPNSGAAHVAVPGSEGAGQLIPQALEMSNVDLAQEFTDMIITQRGFQANSRIITVSDSMLEELVNLKR